MNTHSEDLVDFNVPCRFLVETSPLAVIVLLHNRVVLVNDRCLRLLGATERGQILGLSPSDLVPGDDHPFLVEQCEQVEARGESVSLTEIGIRRIDGTSVKVESLGGPLPHPSGSVAVLLALRDITSSPTALAKQGHLESPLLNIIDTAMDGIISINAEQKIVLFNTAAETIFGWRADEVLGQPIDVLIPGRFRVQHHHDVEQFGRGAIEHRRMGTQRTVMALRASGEEFPIEASISRTTEAGERIYTVILRDVTEAVRSRQQIEQQSEMLDQVSDAVRVLDREGRITFWNRAACRVFGWTAKEALGKISKELLYRGEETVFQEMLREVNARGSWAGELANVTQAGKPIIVEHRRSVLHDESGAPIGYLCIDIDVTERKKWERAANRSQRLESIGTLAGGIAHDLNNVLTPILMGAQLLASGRMTGDPKGLLGTMVASAQRGAGLIRQLLAFAGGVRGEVRPVQIELLVAETRQMLEHTLPKSITIKTRVDSNCPLIMGDATELSQILMNLCVNARDAMPDGGTLTIEVSPALLNGNSKLLNPEANPGEYLLIEVSDTGIGMTSELLDRIFDPFFTTKEVGKGTGLGLATVRGIVKSHSGFINVYSEPGRGSKFAIFLPTVAEPESTGASANQPVVESGRGLTVLLVDDESTVLQMTSAALESNGYRVLTAPDGAAAISRYSRHRDEIVVVLLDMMMPGLDGVRTLDNLMKINSQVKVIACSGLQTSQRETEILEHGAKAFLAKPYTEGELLRTLAQVLNLHN